MPDTLDLLLHDRPMGPRPSAEISIVSKGPMDPRPSWIDLDGRRLAVFHATRTSFEKRIAPGDHQLAVRRRREEDTRIDSRIEPGG